MLSKEQFKHQVLEIAAEIGVEPSEIHVREMKHKWASCSTKGRLTFSAELLGEPKQKRREVMVHELLHLRYPNHGRMFRAMLRAYLGQGSGSKAQALD